MIPLKRNHWPHAHSSSRLEQAWFPHWILEIINHQISSYLYFFSFKRRTLRFHHQQMLTELDILPKVRQAQTDEQFWHHGINTQHWHRNLRAGETTFRKAQNTADAGISVTNFWLLLLEGLVSRLIYFALWLLVKSLGAEWAEILSRTTHPDDKTGAASLGSSLRHTLVTQHSSEFHPFGCC